MSLEAYLKIQEVLELSKCSIPTTESVAALNHIALALEMLLKKRSKLFRWWWERQLLLYCCDYLSSFKPAEDW